MKQYDELKRLVDGYDASLSIRENATKLGCTKNDVQIAQCIITYMSGEKVYGQRTYKCTDKINEEEIFKPYFNKINDFCLGKIDKSAEELFGDYYNDWDSFDNDIKDTICNQCNVTLEELRNYFDYVTML